jgi:DNA-binding NtrC family response regulator
MKPPGTDTSSEHTIKILSVSPSDVDHEALYEILQGPAPRLKTNCTWIVQPVASLASAAEALAREEIPIVICECNLPSGTWRRMLDVISLSAEPSLLIVASRSADERLWAEALNLGAWDVLAKPFNADEVLRVLESAWRHRQGKPGPEQKSARTGR